MQHTSSSNRSKNHSRGRWGIHKKKDQGENEVNSILLQNFKKYAEELDDKHDRYERIIKISRDITIESKRIIFLLHTIDIKKGNSDKVLAEAKHRLQNLFANQFYLIAKELHKMDAYQYSRAYSAGLQEFIEAFSFYEYLNKSNLSSWEIIQNHLKFDINVDVENIENKIESENMKNIELANTETKNTIVSCLVQPTEYILGLADVSGELMRRCINSLGVGDIEVCFECCRVLQIFFTGFVGLDTFRQRDLARKISTLRQSVLKTEQVCYNIKVRGSEAALLGAGGEATYLSFVGEENDKIDEDYFD
ncbi:translin-associated protein X [Condylostylus longicornis]|uniref:translin-associated protein X n=1 Tax=Condylostylus longicornis TaxID=2530218 RepID=UPI00244DE66B|nr:translin-associated protein X [Condylostylus longicornis]